MSEHKGKVIKKVEERHFAYHDELSYPGAYIQSFPSERGTDRDERKKYSEYEFTIRKSTDHSLIVNLKKHRTDIVQQRKESGRAVLYENYQRTLSFGELMNLIFGEGCEVYLDEERFPDEVAELMKSVYSS